MAIKFFWIFIGSFLVCSVLLVTLVKQFSADFGDNTKKPVLFSSLTSVGSSGIAYLATVIDKHLFVVYWFLVGVFLLVKTCTGINKLARFREVLTAKHSGY